MNIIEIQELSFYGLNYMHKIAMSLLGFVLCQNAYCETFALHSTAFHNSSTIPVTYTCDGENISPPFSWVNSPPQTKSYVFIVYNPDAPFGIYYNWILFNIPKKISSLPEAVNKNLPDEAQVGATSSGDSIYRGPCPPNPAIHHYVFKIYALDTTLELSSGVSVDEVMAHLKNHVLAAAELVGTFNH